MFRLLSVLLLLLLLAAAYVCIAPYGPGTETFVDIPSGMSTPRIAALLEEHGVIRSRYAFDLMRLWKPRRLQAGEYRFNHRASLTEVYERLGKGDVYTLTLVIPPGYNIFDIAAEVQTSGLGSEAAFLAAEQKDTGLVQRWSPKADSLEGFLFPDTYRFNRHATPDMMLATMVRRWERATQQLRPEAAAWTPFLAAPGSTRNIDWKEVVIMASLIEKEVSVGEERSLVAGVFVNRLHRGMPLQTDPAVIYAALLSNRYRGVIHVSDLQYESPYNTYRHTGLPPGPICNPGLDALRAALAPAKTGYLYFVSDPTGHSRFAATLPEHTRNVALARAIQPAKVPVP